MPVIQSNSCPLHVEVEGPERAPAIMLCNSLGTTLAMWDAQVKAFARHFRVVRYDRRGHGRSGVTKGPYSMAMLGQDALAIMDALDLKKVNWCGLSMGGMVGQWLGANAPDRIERLVLANTHYYYTDKEFWSGRIKLVSDKGLAHIVGPNMERWFTREFREREPETRTVEGIDIVIALDLSTSMSAADFLPRNRLHVAKEVLKEFMGRRPSDRIGLVIFAGEAYTQAPLTLDHEVLKTLVDQLEFGLIEDRTAIGNAIATALNRLRESDAKSKVVILITDGDNNAGQVSPRQAAEMARSLGVRVFPILVGKGGVVPVPVPGAKDLFGQQYYDYQRMEVNPELLREIARISGGAYANAGDRTELERGLQAVLDRMEKTRIFETTGSTRSVELFPRLLGPAFWLGALGLLLGLTRWRTFP